jgi:hypothetical protein
VVTWTKTSMQYIFSLFWKNHSQQQCGSLRRTRCSSSTAKITTHVQAAYCRQRLRGRESEIGIVFNLSFCLYSLSACISSTLRSFLSRGRSVFQSITGSISNRYLSITVYRLLYSGFDSVSDSLCRVLRSFGLLKTSRLPSSLAILLATAPCYEWKALIILD